MQRMPSIGFVLALAIFSLAMAHAQEKAAPQEVAQFARYELTQKEIESQLGTDWYGVYVLNNQKIGYAKTTFVKIDDAKNPGYRMGVEISARITAANVKAELEFGETQDFDAKPPYALRYGRSIQADGKSVQTIELKRADKGFEVTTAVGNDRQTRKVPALDFTLADTLTPIVWIRRAPKPGDKLTTRNFDFDDLKIDREIREHLSSKEATVSGVKVTYHELKVTLPKEKLTGTERFDQSGKLINGKIGGVFEMRLEPEAQAKDLGKSVDLFVLGTVKIDKPLGEATQVAELVVEVAGKEAGVLKPGPRQAITQENGKTIARLGKAHARPVKAEAKDIEESLEETATYPLTHPKVQTLMKQAVGDAQTPEEKVKRLVGFVHRHIQPSYTAQPLTLLDLIEKREGDCSEYALLFTTLARAAGVPAREVSGLMYMGDKTKAFGPHAWNEVVLDGHWTPIDAAWDQTEIDATHVSFGAGVSGGLEHLSTFGTLSFKLVGVKKK